MRLAGKKAGNLTQTKDRAMLIDTSLALISCPYFKSEDIDQGKNFLAGQCRRYFIN